MNAVKRGESFPEAAAKLSFKPSDVGFVSQSDLDPRLAEYLEKLKPKEVAPVATVVATPAPVAPVVVAAPAAPAEAEEAQAPAAVRQYIK